MPSRLPDFPWDRLAPAKEIAAAHPDGIVDLSVGTPVDPTPEPVRAALAGASDSPGYPTVHGTPAVREAVCAWFDRRRGVPGLDPAGVMPTIGSKELVAWLPTLLGLGPGDRVGIPPIAYPTYDVGARLAGAEPVLVGSLTALGPTTGATTPRLLWLNTPSNPTGQVLGVGHLRKVVDWARRNDVVVVSDECYAELAWGGDHLRRSDPDLAAPGEVPSLLDPRVTDGDTTGLLVCHSLSKQSNLAGYRAAFVAGDPRLVRRLVEVRRHAGMIVPRPVQEAMRIALSEYESVAEQKARYAARRDVLRPALVDFGFEVAHSEAGLYLWVSQGRDCWSTVRALAERGILVAPGTFYGEAGHRHVRIALTAADERVAAAARRLAR